MHTSYAISPDKAVDVQSNLRILKLLPHLFYPLAVEPKIPDDFIAMSPKGKLNGYDWTYWGPKEVLEEYFKDPASLKVPILRVKLSENTVQTGPETFSENAEINNLKKKYPQRFKDFKHRWGMYPVWAFQTDAYDKMICMAWIGLNAHEGEGGWTLLVNLVYPEGPGHPDQNDLKLWDTFITQTKQLSEPEYFIAYGQNLQPGYTIMDDVGVKLTVTAEKRERDGKVQVVVIPSSSDVKFQYAKMEEVLLGSKWNHAAPLLKVYGSVSQDNPEFGKVVLDQVISVLLETVPEFSVDKDRTTDRKDLLIYQSQS
ncbi:MAG: hypothetical protein AB7E63_09920 [Parachlamydia sp.]|jgi:hypothetical protein|nr:hypothetical protein [Parachlamydia acanthamoebae]EFB40457.1 hypothetical protein pah_c205o114 [Parachlamydia acanthamoebae str. Hall's coccus]